MGSRLELNPGHIFECYFEVEAPSDENPDPKIVKRFPADYEDEVADKELPKFCFPYDLKRYNPAGQFFTFVLIGLDNKKRFGFCRHPPGAKTCLCILSYLPWFEICYKMLNSLAEFNYHEQTTAGSKLLTQLYTLPVPDPGKVLKLTVSERGSKTEFSFACPDPQALPRIPENRNITEFFSAIEPSNMMLIFVSLLYERRVLITSNKLSRLTACVHGAASLLFPLYWQHIYIPVMPTHLIDYCCAPMPYLVGVHDSFMPQIRRNPIDEAVILNADTNEIENPFADIETIPSDIVRQLKNNLKNTATLSGDGVARAFLKTMVRLIGNYKQALKLREGEEIVFDKDFFADSRGSGMRECLERILQMQHFTQFIDARVDNMNDGHFDDDLFEEEILNTGDITSKKWKTAISRLTESTATDGRRMLLSTVKGMRNVASEVKKTAQETINDVNSETMKHYFQQTKDLAKDGVSEFKKKMGSKGKEVDDLDTQSLGSVHSLDVPSRPLSSSAPTSPNSSPKLGRKAANGQAKKYQGVSQTDTFDRSRRRSGAMDSSDNSLQAQRNSASEKSKQYKEITFDEEAPAPPPQSDIDLVGDVNKALKNRGIEVEKETDDVPPLPLPPRRKHRPTADHSSSDPPPALPPPPTAPPRRRRSNPRTGTLAKKNLETAEDLIDIGLSADHRPVGVSQGAHGNAAQAPSGNRMDPMNPPPVSPTVDLLKEYGLQFPPPAQGAVGGDYPDGVRTQRTASNPSPMPKRPLVPPPKRQSAFPSSSSTGGGRFANPNYEQTFLSPAPRGAPNRVKYANPNYEQTFSPSVPQVTTTRFPSPNVSNGAKAPSNSSKASSSAGQLDPFADLVSLQRNSFDT